MTTADIATIVHGTLHGDDVVVTKAPVFDSRLAEEGSIFLALIGENGDGHDYVSDASSRGAAVSITTRVVNERCIVVDNVLDAIALLATYVRSQLLDMKVIAITGSQGKTTTKDLLRHVLSVQGQTVATQASFNNELGLPITLLQCDHSTKYCILEMGARHKGDIASLAKIAKPDIGVVLKVGTAHVGEFGDVETIASTKGELIEALGPDGIAILGTYDPYTPQMRKLHEGRVLTFGEDSDADIRATDVDIREGSPHFDLVTQAGREGVGMHLVGSHQVSNALACAAVATALNLPLDSIASALSTISETSKWRMQIHEVKDLLIINDAYNANPDSMTAALRTLVHFAQERGGASWAFLGKMHELGESSAQEHASIGTLALELGIDHLVAIASPDYLRNISADAMMTGHQCQDLAQALSLVEFIDPGDVALFKASRAEKLEVVAEEVEKAWSMRIEEEEK